MSNSAPRLQVRRPVPPRSTPIEQLSTIELQAELQRRVRNLQEEREKLAERVQQINIELQQLGAAPTKGNGRRNGTQGVTPAAPSGRRGRRGPRPRNERPLIEVLRTVLDGSEGLTTRDAADAAINAGYLTTSKQFRTVVNTTLSKDERFERRDGKWTLQSS